MGSTSRINISEGPPQADLAEHRKADSDAVEARLRLWDAHIDDLENTVDDLHGASRERAQQEVLDLRREKDAVADRAAEAQDASGDRRQELNEDVAQAFESLDRRADEVVEKLRAKRPG